MKKILLLIAIAIITGCASPSYNYYPPSSESNTPLLNQETTVNVGDNLLESGKYQEYDAIYIPPNTKINIPVSKGIHLKIGSDDNGDYYSLESQSNHNINSDQLTIGAKSLFIEKKSLNTCIIAGLYNNKLCVRNPNIIKTKTKVYTLDSFQQTLIYNGKIGNKINISYREFSSGIARAAFTNNVEYDLSTSNIIAYKGSRLKVLSANNESIKYKVLSYFK